MEKDKLINMENKLAQEFNNDSQIIGEQVFEFLRIVYPAYLQGGDIESCIDDSSSLRIQSMTFYKIDSCTMDNDDKPFDNLSEKFTKLFTALHSINISVAYGIISRNGITNLVIGIYQRKDVNLVKTMMQGMLSGIELMPLNIELKNTYSKENNNGILTGIPSLYVKNSRQRFSLSSIMRGLNGQEYTLLFIAKPVENQYVNQNINGLISIKDKAYAVSKRSIARSNSYAETKTETENVNDSKNNIEGHVFGGAGVVAGAFVGGPVGAAIGGGLGTIIGNIIGQGKSHSKGYSESISKAITEGETISGDIQNSFALELMEYADSAIERLKNGRNTGMWQTAIVYSAETKNSRDIIRACLTGEFSKLDSEKLPMLAFEPKSTPNDFIIIPDFLETEAENPLCSYLNSAELGLLCTVPDDNVPDFELRFEKKLPLIANHNYDDEVVIGNVVDGKMILGNMPFTLGYSDLNKHTFVCGITGSGKTTTVKKILMEAKKPFLIIESAKKEYRSIAAETVIYTLGRPEINAPRINPFYILPGVNPQVHIDFLKDLFNASFSFYGPMPYILEKCLHAVYKNRGWDLTLGYHPLLSNCRSVIDFFSIDYIREQYSCISHKYLFPTMQDLKDEIARYIDNELKYDGEVAGNVKTAMKVRLENLCIGAKGYTFNTSDFIDFNKLVNENVVFELEGLADDSDKAFSVGLLLIFLNEYRQVSKEIAGTRNAGLQHLLVIEEAHRLLKNMNTERSTESVGNPKGKAIEHFTNMIAEMRSYGQGVIVAEQIPTKLAPDIIKNSSTKIVHRIVSFDDQKAISNTIGLSESESMQLGSLESGYVYCHKEGMSLPSPVRVIDNFFDNGEEKGLDVYVSDEQLYNSNVDRFKTINLSIIKSTMDDVIEVKQLALGMINTFLTEDDMICKNACKKILKKMECRIRSSNIQFVIYRDTARMISEYLTDYIIAMMTHGVYKTNFLPDNNFIELVKEVLYSPSGKNVIEIRERLKKLYAVNLKRYALTNVAALVQHGLKKDTDIRATIHGYFADVSDSTVSEIEKMVKGGAIKQWMN